MISFLGATSLKRVAATIDELKSRANRLYWCCVLASCGAASLIAFSTVQFLADQTTTLPLGAAVTSSLLSLCFILVYRSARRPIEKHESRKAALREAFRDVRCSCSDRVDELFQSSPAARVERLLTESLSKIEDIRDSVAARWERMSLWGKLTNEPPDLQGLDKKRDDLEKAKRRLIESGKLQKTRAFFDDMEERSQNRIDALEHAALKSIPQSHLEPYAEKSIAKSALLFSAMSVPVSAWGDFSQAGNIYDTLREVNGNYEGMADFDIWLNTLMLPGESLAGLVSLTKGAYFEKLVEADLGGERFEHFNHPDTDIVIDGVAYQLKATESASYVESVADGIPVIATTEVAGVTDAIDAGYSNVEIEGSVELALGGSVIDIKDTALDALLTGVGGLGIFATIKGINHAADKYQKGGDGGDAILEGVGVAITGTAKGFVDTAELGYNVISSRPSRFVGRTALKVMGMVDRKIFGG